MKTDITLNNVTQVTWVAMGPWSNCSKPCGGGKSYLQRLCIIPKGRNETCEGERILTRDCNMHPCNDTRDNKLDFSRSDNFTVDYNMLPKASPKTTLPINSPNKINILPVSRKPYRYEKCIMKEGDLALFIDEGVMKGARIPVRVILNNKTLTVYSNDNYENIIVAHNLPTITGLKPFEKDKSATCFEIESSTKKTILCTFVSGTKSLQTLAKEWMEDILDFIKNCANYYSHELNYQQMDMSPEKVQNALDFYQEKEKEQMEKIISRTQQMALQAMEKELKVENMIEKEEEERQKQQEETFKKDYEKIKAQKELINQALEQKKKQADLYSHKLLVKKKIKQISEQVKREVMRQREDMKLRILAKQKDLERKKELIQNKIQDVKEGISKELIKASKNGNAEECDPERPNEQIIKYCRVNFDTDYKKMNQCVQGDNFCYMCCESEFGDLHLEGRSNCYNKCDDFHILKKKFSHTETIKIDVEVGPNGTKSEQIKEEKSISNPSNNNMSLPRFLSVDKKKVYDFSKTKFIETNMKISVPDNKSSINKEADMADLIEKTKKTELLKLIKDDLNSLDF
jgi:hypothetical protein